ncbi:hypothetical protein O5275_13925 [Escherichia coli]|nr:hypothetical protein [Escherichia coli]
MNSGRWWAFSSPFWGFAGWLTKWLFSKAEERQAARFCLSLQSLQQSASSWGELEKELMRFKADLPLNCVRREDWYPWLRLSSRPNWTALYNKLEVVQQ